MTDLEKQLSRILLIMIVGLFLTAWMFGFGKVQEATSFGLSDIIKAITLLAAGIIGILSQAKKEIK